MDPLSKVLRPRGVEFSYTLATDAVTSAGVYDSEDRLVRTLWSGKQDTEGEHFAVWDGKNDSGINMPEDQYNVKVVSNNIQYEHISVIGNNTTWRDRNTVMQGPSFFGDFAYNVYDGKMYFIQPYTEGQKVFCANFDPDTPTIDNKADRRGVGLVTAQRVATDGDKLYYATTEAKSTDEKYGLRSFVYAYDLANQNDTRNQDKHYEFTYGQPAMNFWGHMSDSNKNGDPVSPYPSVIAYREAQNESEYGFNIGGLDVQKDGNLLFVSYKVTNEVYVLDKDTGETLNIISMNYPRALCTDGGDGLWISHKKGDGTISVNHYVVGNDYSLTIDKTINKSFDDVADMTMSPDGTVLAVAEGGNTNIIHGYLAETGEEIWSYGSGESYLEDPTVQDDKLMLSIPESVIYDEQTNYAFVEFEDGNTLWLGEQGNKRIQKLDLSSGTPVRTDMICNTSLAHSCAVNANDPTRVYVNGLEFEIDYSETDYDKSWSLKRNWLMQAYGTGWGWGDFMEGMTTLADGRTFFKILNEADQTKHLYELTENSFRKTKHDLTSWTLNPDGSIARCVSNCEWYVRDFTGTYDQDGDPIWGEERELVKVGGTQSPYEPKGYTLKRNLSVTDSGIVPVLQTLLVEVDDKEKPVMHLGGVDINRNHTEWQWQTAPQGSANYEGDFPDDGTYEVGNGVRGRASAVKAYKDFIIYQYYGEFYKNGQTNKFYHYTDDGLLIGIFGGASGQQRPYGTADQDQEVFKKIAGNAHYFFFVNPNNEEDSFYMIHNDESHLGGLWRWKVSGLDTVREYSYPVKLDDSAYRDNLKWEYYADKNNVSNTSVTAEGELLVINQGPDITVEPNGLLRYSGLINTDTLTTLRIFPQNALNVEVRIDGKLMAEPFSATTDISVANLTKGVLHNITIDMTRTAEEYKAPRFKAKIVGGGAKLYDIDGYLARENDRYNHGTVRKYDLLEDVPFDTELIGSVNGWYAEETPQRIAVTEYNKNNPDNQLDTRTYAKVKTNVANDSISDKRDVSIQMSMKWDTLNSSTVSQYYDSSHTVTRDLAKADANLKSWKLDSLVSAVGYLNFGPSGKAVTDTSTATGSVVDILDENGKIIARFNWGGERNGNYLTSYGFYANDNKLFWTYPLGTTFSSGGTPAYPQGHPIMNRTYRHEFVNPSELVISASENGITFSYWGESDTYPVYEEGAQWNKPATLRVSQFSNYPVSIGRTSMEVNFAKLDYIMTYNTAE